MVLYKFPPTGERHRKNKKDDEQESQIAQGGVCVQNIKMGNTWVKLDWWWWFCLKYLINFWNRYLNNYFQWFMDKARSGLVWGLLGGGGLDGYWVVSDTSVSQVPNCQGLIADWSCTEVLSCNVAALIIAEGAAFTFSINPYSWCCRCETWLIHQGSSLLLLAMVLDFVRNNLQQWHKNRLKTGTHT